MKYKSCTTSNPCPFKLYNSEGFFGCQYIEYCDFQLPRDSRMKTNPTPDVEEERC